MRRSRRRLTSRVVGTASPVDHEYLRSLGRQVLAYGEDLSVRRLSPQISALVVP
jgi:hypothetical protein